MGADALTCRLGQGDANLALFENDLSAQANSAAL
jgi:hypothetical protein